MSFQVSSFSRELLIERLRSVAAPIFAAIACENRLGARLVVHAPAVSHRGKVKSEIKAALAGLCAVTVRFHSPASLLAPRSLERLVDRFAGGEVLYDPTGSIGRAKALVEAAHAVRRSLRSKARGLFYSPRLRALFVELDAKHIGTGDKVKVGELAGIERDIATALRSAYAGQMGDAPAVRVGFGVPVMELVAVDQRSVAGWGIRIARAVRRTWKPIAIATLFGLGANAAAAKDPAVSETNLKVTGTAGSADSDSAWFVGGILTAPLGNSWGVQVEGAVAGLDGDTLYGLGGHIFTRDPDSYLLGLFAAYASEEAFDLDATRLGAEAEIYLSNVTLLAKAGYQFSDTLGDGSFADIELRWYLSDNFALSGGAGFDQEATIGRLSAEWQPGFSALPGLAFRVDGVVGEGDYESIMGGFTYYFGSDATLKDRHRRQDPDSALLSLFQAVQSEQQQLCAYYGC